MFFYGTQFVQFNTKCDLVFRAFQVGAAKCFDVILQMLNSFLSLFDLQFQFFT